MVKQPAEVEPGQKYDVVSTDGAGKKTRRATVLVKRKLDDEDEKSSAQDGDDDGPTSFEYYVHYDDLDRRWDEWVLYRQLIPIKAPRNQRKRRSSSSDGRMRTRQKLRVSEVGPSSSNANEDEPLDVAAVLEDERIKTTSVKQIELIRLGNFELHTWYHSPFPDAFQKRKIFVCSRCLRYQRTQLAHQVHLHDCRQPHPPGREIYRDGTVAVYEVLGQKQKMYAQCLCLLGKLFIDHKTIFYHLDNFAFYVLCEIDNSHAQLAGYFSKELDSADHNNLNCIVVLPTHQRRGYGRFLVELSYALSEREGTPGGPERPLSDFGRLTYHSMWTQRVLDCLAKLPPKTEVSAAELARRVWMRVDDVEETLLELNLLTPIPQLPTEQYVDSDEEDDDGEEEKEKIAQRPTNFRVNTTKIRELLAERESATRRRKNRSTQNRVKFLAQLLRWRKHH